MITCDTTRTVVVEAPRTKVVRVLPLISKKFQSASSRVKKEAFVQQQLQKAAHHDDPVLLELEQQYLGKLLFDFEAPKKNRKTYRVTSIETYKHEGAWKYQATCVPVVKSNGGE